MPVKKGAPKKRGRKPKKRTAPVVKPPPKKRGRKPKGGKIIKKNEKIKQPVVYVQPHIILHLKCSTKDITNNEFNATNYTPNISDPQAYNINTNTKMFNLQYEEIKQNHINRPIKQPQQIIKDDNSTDSNDKIDKKELWNKLNLLKNNLRCNNVSDKRSACFWCTYEFDNPAVYIPKHYNNEYLEVYGCFCSPECALAYLKNEEIDNSTKWERYALLNNVYSKIFDYTKNIKPAPNPHYTLDKYYGNLNITEYRQLLNNERILMVVDKPMTKVLPELYEENNEMPNVYGNMLSISEKNNNKSTFRLKRSQTKKSKSNALTTTFNL